MIYTFFLQHSYFFSSLLHAHVWNMRLKINTSIATLNLILNWFFYTRFYRINVHLQNKQLHLHVVIDVIKRLLNVLGILRLCFFHVIIVFTTFVVKWRAFSGSNHLRINAQSFHLLLTHTTAIHRRRSEPQTVGQTFPHVGRDLVQGLQRPPGDGHHLPRRRTFASPPLDWGEYASLFIHIKQCLQDNDPWPQSTLTGHRQTPGLFFSPDISDLFIGLFGLGSFQMGVFIIQWWKARYSRSIPALGNVCPPPPLQGAEKSIVLEHNELLHVFTRAELTESFDLEKQWTLTWGAGPWLHYPGRAGQSLHPKPPCAAPTLPPSHLQFLQTFQRLYLYLLCSLSFLE